MVSSIHWSLSSINHTLLEAYDYDLLRDTQEVESCAVTINKGHTQLQPLTNEIISKCNLNTNICFLVTETG